MKTTLRLIVLLSIVVLLVGGAVIWGDDVKDYVSGYRHGKRQANDMRTKMGIAADFGGQLMNSTELYPVDSTKPERWQQGYQQAMRNAFPETRR